MEHEHPFIAEVRAHPEEDEPRLIYADYLEEAGDEQGELIRVQVALARLPPGEVARRELELREEELLTDYAEPWIAPLRELGATGVHARSFRRGLIERVKITARDFCISCEELCRLAPALSAVEFIEAKGQLAELCRQKLPDQITAVDLSSARLGPADVAELSQAGWTKQVESLTLNFGQLDDEAVQTVLRGDWSRLRGLGLSVNRLGPAALTAIARHQPLLGLTRLNLSVNRIGNEGLQVLANSPLAHTLRELDVSTTGVTSAGLLRVAESPLLHALERFNVRGNPLGPESERALAALGQGARLKYLDLRGTHREIPRSGYGNRDHGPPPELASRLGEGLLW